MKKFLPLLFFIPMLYGMQELDPSIPDPRGINHLARLPIEIQCYIASFLSFPREEVDAAFKDRMKIHNNNDRSMRIKKNKGFVSGQVVNDTGMCATIEVGPHNRTHLSDDYTDRLYTTHEPDIDYPSLIGISQDGRCIAYLRILKKKDC